MDKEEQEILLLIGDYLESLKEETKGSTNSRGTIPPSGTSYTSYAHSLYKEIAKLKEKFNPEYLDTNALYELNDYLNKEVAKVNDAHDAAHKEKATKADKERLVGCMNDATFHIGMAIPILKEKVRQTIADVENNRDELIKQPLSQSSRIVREYDSRIAIIYDFGIYFFCKKNAETKKYEKYGLVLEQRNLDLLFSAEIRRVNK